VVGVVSEIFGMRYRDVQHAGVIRWSMVHQYMFTTIYSQLIGTKWKSSPHLCHCIHITVEYRKLGGSFGLAAVP